MSKDRIVILNSISGSVRNRAKIEKSLSRLGEVYTIKEVEDFPKCYKKIIQKKPNVVVLAGGDGTFIHGVEQLKKLGYEGDFAVIPLGTANYVARNLNIPLTLEKSVQRVISGSPLRIPVAQVNDKFFMLYVAVGLSQKVAANASVKLKKRFGQAAYVMELARQSRQSKAFKYTISSPQLSKDLSGKSHQMLIYNSNLNSQIYIAPKHSIEDSSLKIVIADTGKSIIKLYIGWLLMMVSLGVIRQNLTTAEIHEADIRIAPKQSVDFDGEILKSDKYHVRIGKEYIRVIC